MNKRLLLVSTVLGLVIIGSLAYVGFSDREEQTIQDMTNRATDSNTTPDRQPASTTRAGIYTDYSADKLQTTSGTRLLFFHAPWCPQCRALEADIKQQGVPAGVTIFKVDYDSNQSLRQQYGVTIQTTVVHIDTDSKLVEKYVAYDEPTLAKVEENLLQP